MHLFVSRRQITYRKIIGCKCKWVELPSDMVDMSGSWSIFIFGCCFVNFCRGIVEVNQFRVWFTWAGAPCQVGTSLCQIDRG